MIFPMAEALISFPVEIDVEDAVSAIQETNWTTMCTALLENRLMSVMRFQKGDVRSRACPHSTLCTSPSQCASETVSCIIWHFRLAMAACGSGATERHVSWGETVMASLPGLAQLVKHYISAKNFCNKQGIEDRSCHAQVYGVSVGRFAGMTAPSEMAVSKQDASISFQCNPANAHRLVQLALSELSDLQVASLDDSPGLCLPCCTVHYCLLKPLLDLAGLTCLA